MRRATCDFKGIQQTAEASSLKAAKDKAAQIIVTELILSRHEVLCDCELVKDVIDASNTAYVDRLMANVFELREEHEKKWRLRDLSIIPPSLDWEKYARKLIVSI